MKGPKPTDLSGRIYTRWTVIAMAPITRDKRGRIISRYVCKCQCGNEVIVRRSSLVRGNSRSCGCLQRELAAAKKHRHGHSANKTESPIHRVWSHMKQRCHNPDSEYYHRYGGRGIKLCPRWESFDNFLADMSPRPLKATIDRIDNNGNYEPSNCRWATRKQQANNRSTNKYLTVLGVTFSRTEWCTRIGMSRELLRGRLRHGWTPEEAIYTPSEKRALASPLELDSTWSD